MAWYSVAGNRGRPGSLSRLVAVRAAESWRVADGPCRDCATQKFPQLENTPWPVRQFSLVSPLLSGRQAGDYCG